MRINKLNAIKNNLIFNFKDTFIKNYYSNNKRLLTNKQQIGLWFLSRFDCLLALFGYKRKYTTKSLTSLYEMSNDNFFLNGQKTSNLKSNSFHYFLTKLMNKLFRNNFTNNFILENNLSVNTAQNGVLNDKEIEYFNKSQERIYKIFNDPSLETNDNSAFLNFFNDYRESKKIKDVFKTQSLPKSFDKFIKISVDKRNAELSKLPYFSAMLPYWLDNNELRFFRMDLKIGYKDEFEKKYFGFTKIPTKEELDLFLKENKTIEYGHN